MFSFFAFFKFNLCPFSGIKLCLQGFGRVAWDESKSYTKGAASSVDHKNLDVYLDEVMIMHRGMCHRSYQLKNPGRQDMPFTPFVLRVLPVYCHCEVSIGVLFFDSNTVLSSLHLDFPNDCLLYFPKDV